jgi:1,4-dihydroxy-2-naphthoate octaprenyltransferase
MDHRVSYFLMRITRPMNLLAGVLLYALGVGIARYLGNPIDWGLVFIGQAWVVTFQLGAHFLAACFLLPTRPGDPNCIPVPKEESQESPQGIRRDLILWASAAAFTTTAFLTLILIRFNSVNGAILFLMGMMFVGGVLYSVPPFQLATSGYGEFILSFILANLVPALGFILQHGVLHRLVAMSTFPLTMLFLAMLLANQLPEYHLDVHRHWQNLLVRLGWERGMIFHNLLILGAFLLIGIAMFFGLPAPVGLPVFFVLPLGLFQIWYITRIAAGVKPNWRVLNLTALLTFGLTAYLFAFTFWTR